MIVSRPRPARLVLHILEHPFDVQLYE